MALGDAITVNPSAHRLVSSMRDIGYEPSTAIADLVDNSVSAGASRIDVVVNFDGPKSSIAVLDDGRGMTPAELDEALRFGTRRGYKSDDLGRFGLGLKTASISMGRRLSVATRHAPSRTRIYSRVLDLDRIAEVDRWEIVDGGGALGSAYAEESLSSSTGTVVLIEKLDRILPDRNPYSGWGKRRLDAVERAVATYLSMVFHRFIEGEECDRVVIAVNGTKVDPWNPFAPSEPRSMALPEKLFEVDASSGSGLVRCRSYVLPARNEFSSHGEFERLGGARRWNRQQGLYIYRAHRLIQSGGWSGMRAADEHTKLARVALDFGTELDEAFKIDVAKMKVTLPPQLRKTLERSVNEVCAKADSVYRSAAKNHDRSSEKDSAQAAAGPGDRNIALALSVAAADLGEFGALERIMSKVRADHPAVAAQLGW